MKRLRWRLVLLGALAVAGLAWPAVLWAQPHEQPTQVNGSQVEEGEPKEGEGEESFEPKAINWVEFGTKQTPFIAVLINFAVLVGIYVYFGKKPIAEALKNRRAAIAKEIEEAQRMKQEAEERAKVYQAKLERLEDELATAKAALIEAGKGEQARIIKDAEEKAARMQKDAEFLIEQEMKQIRQDLWKETVTVAVTAAEELLRKRITGADQERIAEDYLEDLAGRARRPPTMPPASAKGGAS